MKEPSSVVLNQMALASSKLEAFFLNEAFPVRVLVLTCRGIYPISDHATLQGDAHHAGRCAGGWVEPLPVIKEKPSTSSRY